MNIYNGKKFYTCEINEGDEYRRRYLESIDSYMEKELTKAKASRNEFFSPEKLAQNREEYRKKYMEMIGEPKADGIPRAEREFVARDDFSSIERVSIEVADGFFFYGILMIPNGVTRAPLVIAQHGGGGTPEKCGDMWGENNYSYFIKRALEQGLIVFAPQLLTWIFNVPDEPDEPPKGVPYSGRRAYDTQLKRVGMSLTGLEVFCIRRALDWLSSLDCVEEDKIGMMGLSYGGYYTMHTMAADKRIKAGYAAGFFNDRSHECFNDWGYQNAAYMFQDAEVAGLCAPRLLLVDVGKVDPVFGYATSVPEAERAKEYYRAAGVEDKFSFNLWEGGHRFDVDAGRFEKFFAEILK